MEAGFPNTLSPLPSFLSWFLLCYLFLFFVSISLFVLVLVDLSFFFFFYFVYTLISLLLSVLPMYSYVLLSPYHSSSVFFSLPSSISHPIYVYCSLTLSFLITVSLYLLSVYLSDYRFSISPFCLPFSYISFLITVSLFLLSVYRSLTSLPLYCHYFR